MRAAYGYGDQRFGGLTCSEVISNLKTIAECLETCIIPFNQRLLNRNATGLEIITFEYISLVNETINRPEEELNLAVEEYLGFMKDLNFASETFLLPEENLKLTRNLAKLKAILENSRNLWQIFQETLPGKRCDKLKVMSHFSNFKN